MIFCLTLAALLQAAPAVEAAARPQPVLLVEGPGARTLNFDLVIRNSTSVALDVDEIQLSVYDRAGALVLRRFLDGNGSRPSIRTIDAPSVPAGGTALVFNPFDRFDPGLDLAGHGGHRPAQRRSRAARVHPAAARRAARRPVRAVGPGARRR